MFNDVYELFCWFGECPDRFNYYYYVYGGFGTKFYGSLVRVFSSSSDNVTSQTHNSALYRFK
ncbi:MAG: hypothetical protein FWC14_00960, partial [Candidatus Bathyarchaeota archaeon]|uniref:hypothetical protein n=1 Tax=Candidatus Bathycorpusculum sp. TaxID=2994959 RepID=UPI00281CEA7B|nr:hypothetical protein [Candidatus Termiticorpusculum sp.]